MQPREIDIEKYTREYLKEHGKNLSYEAILATIRKKHVLDQVAKYKHDHVLEVGCGLDPLFQYLTGYKKYTIVEPCIEFVQKARGVAGDNSRIKIISGFIEEISKELAAEIKSFDMIVISSLLHEVPDPDNLLQSIHNICTRDTIIHFNVPNVFSFHRLLAYEMGLIDSIFNKSETEQKFQRQTRFDKKLLNNILNKNGFQVEEFGTYFIKLFSNEQMEKLIEQGIVSIDIIEGLDKMVKYLPDMGCEMYVNARIYDPPGC